MLNTRRPAVRANSLSTRYSETFGQLMLRRHTELAMQTAKVEAERASAAKSTFIGTMSHELRTPLNAIIGFSDLIANLKAQPGAVEQSIDYASHISKAGRHLLGIVSDILDMAKIESGTFRLNIDTYPVAAVIDEATAMLQETIDQKKQRLEVRVDPDLPSIPIDARRVKQILINLLSNASKFTTEKGHLMVRAQRAPVGGIIIAVADT